MAEESQDDSQKTEDPTQKRLDESREKGQVPSSREINNWFMLLGGTIIVIAMAPGFMHQLKGLLAQMIVQSHDRALGAGGIGIILSNTIREVGLIMLAPLGLLVVLAALSSMIQHAPLIAFESVKPKFEKISPASGIKRLFSSRSLVEFVKGLLKLVIVGTIATLVVLPQFDSLSQIPLMTADGYNNLMWSISGRLLMAVFAVMTIIAALDFLYQKMEHMKKLRMSRQDIKDEMKQTDGDPMVKARLRQIRTERARQRMMQAVPEATVVITNPTHFAVALKYIHDEMDAPEVVAKGADLIAAKIREIAGEHDIPLVENPPLARALYATTDIGRTIPPEHYRAVAEVIGYVMQLKRRVGGR
jgi:flagellar biosynthetic protein FlhB